MSYISKIIRVGFGAVVAVGLASYFKANVDDTGLIFHRDPITKKITHAQKLVGTYSGYDGDYAEIYGRWIAENNISEKKFIKHVKYEARHPYAKYIYRTIMNSHEQLKYEVITKWV